MTNQVLIWNINNVSVIFKNSSCFWIKWQEMCSVENLTLCPIKNWHVDLSIIQLYTPVPHYIRVLCVLCPYIYNSNNVNTDHADEEMKHIYIFNKKTVINSFNKKKGISFYVSSNMLQYYIRQNYLVIRSISFAF